ncbi:MAG: helix-turn-helix transcriptional regulator [Bacteroidia bacterium]|jgi:transcriptional regulator with XRE-family HTH domain|nr:helix-turn-helix transcriptional regulator [Bacteroidia bacterium]
MQKHSKNHIGNNIRILRVTAGLSQAELGERIGKTRGMISHIEVFGKVNHRTLVSIAEALQTTVENIQTFTPSQPVVTANQATNQSDQSTHYANDHQYLKREISLLEELVTYQKRIIHLLEQKLETEHQRT